MTGLLEDVRYGLRALAKHRAFSAVAVVSLALGIGANTTIFTMVHAILMRQLPVSEPDRLVALYTVDSHNPGLLPNSYPNYQDYRDHNQVFSSLLLYTGVGLTLSGGTEPRLVMGQIATANYFSTLGISPVVGRTFLPEEDASPGASPVAIIGYRFWQREFGGAADITSRAVRLNGRQYRIVGVAPPGFEGLDTLTATEIWLPLMMYPDVLQNKALVNQRQALLFSVVGRLKQGISLARAEAELKPLSQDLETRFPKENAGQRCTLTSLKEAALPAANRAQITDAGTVLLIVSWLVLIIACGNVASLLLARGAGRNREISVRLALGASRWRLIRQLLTESVLLAVLGGLAGLVFGVWVRDLLWAWRPPIFRYAAVHLQLDRTVLAYNLGVSLLTGILFGLVPALRATRSDLAVDLKERSGMPASSSGRWNPRSLLVMGQVAFSVVALVGAGLFVRSLRNADRFDPGFDAAHLGVVVFDITSQGYDEPRGRDLQQRVLDRASAVPGVVSATIAKDWPFHVSLRRTIFVDGAGAGTGTPILAGFSFPGYLRSVGIPLLRGRDFTVQDDKTSPQVIIINESAARTYWAGEDPIGKQVRFLGDPLPAQVIGVARNANYQSIGERAQPMVYMSLTQRYFPAYSLYIRTQGAPDAVLESVRREVQSLDRELLLQAESVHTTIQQALWAQRLSASLLSVFGALALLLATIGIYGVVSYSVTQRVREFGIRLALGATAGEVQLMLLLEGVRLVTVGVLLGTTIALIAARAVQSMLFTISPRDSVTFILVPAILTLVAILACWIPAHRATRIDPAVALRDE